MSADCACNILILGGGFGGIYAAIELERALRNRNNVKNQPGYAGQLLSIQFRCCTKSRRAILK